MRTVWLVLATLIGVLCAPASQAQDAPLTFLTIERPPFAFEENGEAAGFSIELMRRIGEELGRDVAFTFVDEFPQMLSAVAEGEVDGAVANISITSEREIEMDFSRPIYASGLKIMVSGKSNAPSIWDIVFRWELLALVLLAFGVLFMLGMLMWLFERRKQAYFDQDARSAMFPSFWWALNLVINGGFEVHVPRSVMGRILGVFMVISSLFVVSIFVANLTAALTVEAITGSIRSLDDLDGKRVGTTNGSTASAFLLDRDVFHAKFATFDELIWSFEVGDMDAVVFDGPILAYYVAHRAAVDAHLLDRVFQPEDYGIALPSGSDLREPINRFLLRLVENGFYADLSAKWFGKAN